MSIRRKVLVGLVLSAAAVAAAFVVGLSLASGQRTAIEGLGALSVKLGDGVIELVDSTAAMKLDVVQVQQFLTDISATRGLDGLDDGDEEAAEFARRFGEDAARARRVAQRLERPEIAAAIDEAEAAFVPYYEAGKKMAAVYVAEGPTGGNALMGKFDAASETLGQRLDAVLEKSATLAKASAKEAGALSARAVRGGELAVVNLIVVGALVLAILLLSALFLWRGVTRPMEVLAEDMSAIGRGDLGRTVHAARRKDELGKMAGALETFRGEQVKLRALEAAAAEREQQAVRERKAALAGMANQLEATVAGVLETIARSTGDVRSQASMLAQTARQASKQADGVGSASTRAAGNVSGVAAAAQQLAASIADINLQVANARSTSSAAVQEAHDSSAAVETLSAAVRRVDDIVKVISSIANQTNLLALNASVEAARAGAAGSGFSIVAREVGNLAVQAGKSASDIRGQVEGMRGAVREVVGAFERVGNTIGRIDGFSAAIAENVEQQRVATKIIAENVQNAAAGTQEVSSSIATVGAAADQTGRAAARMLEVATLLSEESGKLDREVQHFIERVRAA